MSAKPQTAQETGSIDNRVEMAKSLSTRFVDEKLGGDEKAQEAVEEAADNFQIDKANLGKVLVSAKALIGGSQFNFSEVAGFASQEMGRSDRAQIGAGTAVGLIVALTVAAIVAAFLLPIGIEELAGAELGEDASDGATALWGILDVMIILAVFLLFTGIALASM